jgi:hypothetical protein
MMAETTAGISQQIEQIARRSRADDIHELRLERIAIEGEIDAEGEIIAGLRKTLNETLQAIDQAESRIAEQKSRLQIRIDAIAALERAAISGGSN